MIVCTDFFVKAKIPKFLDKTVSKFQMTKNACFLDQEAFDVFLADLRCQLAKDKPVGSYMELRVTTDMAGEGTSTQVAIFRPNGYDTDTVRAQFKEYKTVFRWSTQKAKFINIYYRLED